ncbi:MAG: hypothetical protein MHPSP_002643, partial [Paramarteilia canceri]
IGTDSKNFEYKINGLIPSSNEDYDEITEKISDFMPYQCFSESEEEGRKRAHRFSREQKRILLDKIKEKGTSYISKNEANEIAELADMSYFQVKKFLSNRRTRMKKKFTKILNK